MSPNATWAQLFWCHRNGAESDPDEEQIIASATMKLTFKQKPDFCKLPIARGSTVKEEDDVVVIVPGGEVEP